MSQKTYLKQSPTTDLSTFRDSSKEEGDSDLDAPCSKALSSSEMVYYLHTQDDFPDGGLRAWLVVLGVRPQLQTCGR